METVNEQLKGIGSMLEIKTSTPIQTTPTPTPENNQAVADDAAAKLLKEQQEAAAKLQQDAADAEKLAADQRAKEDAEKLNAEKPTNFLSALETVKPNEKPNENAVELPEDIKAQLAEFNKLKEDLAKQEESDIAKLLKSGLTLKDIAEGIQKVDYSNHTTEDLIRLELKKLGNLEGDAFEKALAEELEFYNTLSPLAKSKREAELREAYKTEVKFDDALSLLDTKLKEASEQQSKVVPPEIKAQVAAQLAKEDLSEIDNVFSSIKANYEIDQTVIDAIKKRYNPIVADEWYLTEDKKFNAAQFIEDTYILLNYKKDRQKDIEAAEKRGYDKAAKEFGNPESGVSGGGAGGEKSVEQQLQESAKNNGGTIVPTSFIKSIIGN